MVLDTLRELEQATPLVFNDPFLITDFSGNVVRDLGYFQTAPRERASARDGRHGPVPVRPPGRPAGHLRGPGGRRPHGRGQLGRLRRRVLAGGRRLHLEQGRALWDSEDYFGTGQGFLDGTINALKAWDPDGEAGAGAGVHVAGGDFTLLDDADISPFGVNTPVNHLSFFDTSPNNNPILGLYYGGVATSPMLDAGLWSPVTAGSAWTGPSGRWRSTTTTPTTTSRQRPSTSAALPQRRRDGGQLHRAGGPGGLQRGPAGADLRVHAAAGDQPRDDAARRPGAPWRRTSTTACRSSTGPGTTPT